MTDAHALSIALGLLAFSAPVTAAVIKNGRSRKNGMTFEQCTALRENMRELWSADLARLEERINNLREVVESGFARIETPQRKKAR